MIKLIYTVEPKDAPAEKEPGAEERERKIKNRDRQKVQLFGYHYRQAP